MIHHVEDDIRHAIQVAGLKKKEAQQALIIELLAALLLLFMAAAFVSWIQ